MRKKLAAPYFVKISLYIWLVIFVVMVTAGSFIISRLYQDTTKNYLDKYSQAVNIPAYSLNTKLQQCKQAFTAIDVNSQLQTYLSLARSFSLLDIVQLKTFLVSFKNSLEAGIEGSTIYLQPFNNVMLASFLRSDTFVPDDIRRVVLSRPSTEPSSIIVTYQKPDKLTLYRANLNHIAIQIMELKLQSLQTVAHRIALPEGAFNLMQMPDGKILLLNGNGVAEETIATAVSEHLNGRVAGYYVLEGNNTLAGPSEGESVLYYDASNGTADRFNCQTLLFLPSAPLHAELLRLILVTAAVAVLTLALMLYLSYIISKRLTRRLYKVIDNIDIEIPASQDAGIPMLESGGDDEFSHIDKRFRELTNRIHDFYRQAQQAEAEKAELEVDLLQEQINPHFLYNTLDGIKWTAQNAHLSDMVDLMVKYYRTVLNRGKRLLTVSEEMEMVEQYLILQRFAYESEFRYSIEADAGTLGHLILKHLLQPIVENALLHGIDKQGDRGMIGIRSWLEDDFLTFEVKDNGKGMSEERIAEINSGSYITLSGSFGLMNIKRRIQAYYQGAEFIIENIGGSGLMVTLRIPLAKIQAEQNRLN